MKPKLKERDIEDALVQTLSEISNWRVVGRQVGLPSGILDVLCLVGKEDDYLIPVVIELKRGRIDAHACTQVIGYTSQLESIIQNVLLDNFDWGDPEWFRISGVRVAGVLVGKNLSKRARRIVESNGLGFIKYSVTPSGGIAFDLNAMVRSGALQWEFRKKEERFRLGNEIAEVVGATKRKIKTDVMIDEAENNRPDRGRARANNG